MALDFWFGQFNTVDGTVQEEGPFIGAFEGGAGDPDAVAVYVLVEPYGSASVELCADTVDAVARGFGEPGQALTASLLRALNAANAHVRARHAREGESEFGVGITVLASRRNEAYVAQAGPALACIRSGGQAKILVPIGDEAVRPVGSGPRVTPSFSRLQLRPGDSAILAFSSGAYLIDRRRLPQLVAQPPEHALPELYLRSRGELNFAALYLSVIGERSALPAPEPRGARAGRWGADRGSGAEPVAQPTASGMETLVAEEDTPVAERRNGHGAPLSGTVRTLTPRRTPLGSLAPSGVPVTRRQLAVVAGAAGVGLLALLALPNLARQGKNEKFSQLVRAADEAIAAAEREPDLARRRQLLANAQATVDEARALRSTAPPELSALDQRLGVQLDEINAVRELADLVPVADLNAPGVAMPSASQLIVGPAIYALDATAGKVTAFQKEGDLRPTTIFSEGIPAGQNRTGRARHITWWAAEGNRPAVLLVLDDQRRLYGVDVRGDVRPVALGETGEWKADTALAMGSSHLYVLDAPGGQVWRYALNAGGFPGSPEPLLGARSPAKDASGLSIAGSPIVSTPDGRLLRIADGREQPLQPIAIDRPLLAPAAPILNAADGLLYIADRGNQRVVRLSPDGVFRGQLTSHRLAGLQAIALDEPPATLYAIAGQSLIKATIPR